MVETFKFLGSLSFSFVKGTGQKSSASVYDECDSP